VENQSEFELKVIESKKSAPSPDGREGAGAAEAVVMADEALQALKATKGAAAVIKQIPNLENVHLWQPTAFFSVCRKTGSARFLDLWDVDHFDGFTDVKRSLDDCRAWFSGDGFQFWGSGQTKTGRVNCHFTVPADGLYVCHARLQSYPDTSAAVVECLIDNSSFGPLTVVGTIDQPHPASLSAGGHHFRIRQRSGSFFFISVTVWRIL
jgi:hypothetical protein